MEKIYILGNKQSKTWSSHLGELLHIPSLSINDYPAIHDYVVNNISGFEHNARIIIDLDAADPVLALTIALHIRLSTAFLSEKTLMPILLVSSLPIIAFLSLGECSQFFLAQKGYAFCSPDQAASSIDKVTRLTADNYKSDFLDRIQVRPDETIGRHSLANQWGADVLAQVVGLDYEPSESILKARKSLYFKYVLANRVNNSTSYIPDRDLRINANGKKILLIDDEASKGWENCLKSIFVGCSKDDFNVVKGNISDYKDLPKYVTTRIDKDDYDLYLIDLRLLGNSEEDIIMTSQFSGFKLLVDILKKNKGNQVIFMTASNKAWNLKNLMSEGANGYYIKETPELMLPFEFSIENYMSFKHDIEKAFECKYKRVLYKKIDYLQKNVKKSKKFKQKQITDELVGILWKSFMPYMIKINSKQDFAASYLILFSIFEKLKNFYISDIDKKGKDTMTHIINEIHMQVGCGNSIWAEIEEVVDARNDYIHPKKDKQPPEFIYNNEGLTKLFDVIKKVLEQLM